jgi:hypothetical protein
MNWFASTHKSTGTMNLNGIVRLTAIFRLSGYFMPTGTAHAADLNSRVDR